MYCAPEKRKYMESTKVRTMSAYVLDMWMRLTAMRILRLDAKGNVNADYQINETFPFFQRSCGTVIESTLNLATPRSMAPLEESDYNDMITIQCI